ncbi:MAG: type II toxin-antitoxin system VapC family toxin [Nitrospirota bacterium]|nr:type II toxin-antitoxin system VapC family toxin [Nitrospirota bacterium]MDE3119221.1 type II toxin-antitoxin system VapC family toxin [Nitrospirota bacterium]MDE3226451.1 type II toxin-antitoxin system VapC family toxin [Nitrospirota bacterium]MDE3243661.1 type II toxin-antitoxin system VapC family toxin [Nitrospirota bacterium]
MIVADTNLLVYLYIEGQRTGQAEAAFAKDPFWVAPLLWRSEFRNTVIGLVRKKALALEDALRIVDDAERAMAGHEYSVLSHHVLQFAARSGCSAYDCEFVALAQDLGVAFVTSDRQVLSAFPALAVSLDVFVA